jgi:hypothetical protein
MVSLNGVVEGKRYMEAVAAIDLAAPGHAALGKLQLYLSAS